MLIYKFSKLLVLNKASRKILVASKLGALSEHFAKVCVNSVGRRVSGDKIASVVAWDMPS